MTTPEENKAVIRRNIAELNEGNLDALFETYSPDVVWHNPIPEYSDATISEWESQVKEQKAGITRLRAAFPDMRTSVEEMIAEGDKVAWRGTFRGTHRGDLGNIPATGRSVEYAIMTLTRL